MNDTICSISTALGIGAISIIRVSGSEAINIVNKIFKGKNLTKCESHTIHYGHIIDKGEVIDEVLISIMLAPKTYTKEDIIEINCHGGISTTNKVLELLILNGCRLAEPGEFTKRAFLNGRIDLIEAESIGDLINSETDKARNLSINSLTGKVTDIIESIREELLSLSANIEVNIDYPEYEDILELTNDLLKPKIKEIKLKLEKLVEESSNSKIIKNGINVAIVGKPNVGKSSLLNALLEEDKAIVTNIAGTTRDIVEGKILLNGIILNLIDTAGIRETDDLVEKIGVEKSKEVIKNSDLVIFVVNNNEILSKDEIDTITSLKNKNIIIFVNKNDLPKVIELDNIIKCNIVSGNTVDKMGLEDLKQKIISIFNLKKIATNNYAILSNARQIALVKKALNSIDNCLDQMKNNIEVDLIAIDLKECYDFLGEILGKTYKDELLDEIFKNFCLGK